MTPTEFILNGLYAACDNAHDMGLKSDPGAVNLVIDGESLLTIEQYALCVILDDICEGGPDAMPECGYLTCQYDDDDSIIMFNLGELRQALGDALVQFHADGQRYARCAPSSSS